MNEESRSNHKIFVTFFVFLNVVIYFLGSQKLAMQRAFFSKYKNCQYIDKDGLAGSVRSFAHICF